MLENNPKNKAVKMIKIKSFIKSTFPISLKIWVNEDESQPAKAIHQRISIKILRQHLLSLIFIFYLHMSYVTAYSSDSIGRILMKSAMRRDFELYSERMDV